MNFEQAVVALKQGQKIRKGNDHWYYCMAGCAGGCMLAKVYKNDCYPSSGIFTSEDLFSDNWQIFSGLDDQ